MLKAVIPVLSQESSEVQNKTGISETSTTKVATAGVFWGKDSAAAE